MYPDACICDGNEHINISKPDNPKKEMATQAYIFEILDKFNDL